MTTINLKAPVPTCGHVHVTVSLNSVERATASLTTDDITTAPTDDELRAAVAVLLRAYKVGRTLVQVRNALTSASGIDVAL